ncbi:MAG: ComF family protein [Gemmatimonadaceae bacterium]|nr:ComF family protein [Gemmatimonadaceae bacterium]
MPLPQLAQHVLDFCYPRACAHCNAACPGSIFLCDECAARLDALVKAPACQRCAMPLSQDNAPCPYCTNRGIRPFATILRLGIYEEPLKDLIHHMKYHKKWALGEHLASRLAKSPRVKQLITDDKIILPVPLHYFRQISRGYNQADVIARRLASHFGCQVKYPVKRSRNTAPQAQIHAQADRKQNLKNAFALKHPRSITGRHVIIVDDVMTSGNTLRALARTLFPARPASISAVVLAIADPIHRDFQKI